MCNGKIREIDFDVVGPITIASEVTFRQEKGFDQHQFYSDIRLKKSTYGIKATITAYADKYCRNCCIRIFWPNERCIGFGK